MNYSIKKSQPCADYGKISLEGNFWVEDRNKFYERLEEFDSVKNIANGKIIIAKNQDLEMYLYDDNRFVMSKLQSEDIGINLLNKIFK